MKKNLVILGSIIGGYYILAKFYSLSLQVSFSAGQMDMGGRLINKLTESESLLFNVDTLRETILTVLSEGIK